MFQESFRNFFAWSERQPAWIRFGVTPVFSPLVVVLWMLCLVPRTSAVCITILIAFYSVATWNHLLPPGFFERTPLILATVYVCLLIGGYMGVLEHFVTRSLSARDSGTNDTN